MLNSIKWVTQMNNVESKIRYKSLPKIVDTLINNVRTVEAIGCRHSQLLAGCRDDDINGTLIAFIERLVTEVHRPFTISYSHTGRHSTVVKALCKLGWIKVPNQWATIKHPETDSFIHFNCGELSCIRGRLYDLIIVEKQSHIYTDDDLVTTSSCLHRNGNILLATNNPDFNVKLDVDEIFMPHV